MRKVEVNNEIVSLRHVVRQARVCVVNKLIRESKSLQSKSGTEKQQEKNKKKADRLISEVQALKSIKDDEITRFGITNEKSLQEILQNPSENESTRILAKIVNYKTLSTRLNQFREKFPDYKEYIIPKKKKSKKKSKSKKLMEKSEDSKHDSNTDIKLSNENSSKETMSVDDTVSDNETDEMECVPENLPNTNNNLNPSDLESGSILRIKPTHTENLEEQDKNTKRKKRKEISLPDTNTNLNNKSETIRIIHKEATVKRFTEVLQEEKKTDTDEKSEERNPKSIEAAPELRKEVDEFFISTSDGNKYHSVVVSKTDDNEINEPSEEQYSRNVNNRFFSKINRPDKPRRMTTGYKQTRNDSFKNRTPYEKGRTENRFNKRSEREISSEFTNHRENENLHPSWVARKKQQEIMKQGFQGKKIVFNDD